MVRVYICYLSLILVSLHILFTDSYRVDFLCITGANSLLTRIVCCANRFYSYDFSHGKSQLTASLTRVAEPQLYFIRSFFYNISTCMQQENASIIQLWAITRNTNCFSSYSFPRDGRPEISWGVLMIPPFIPTFLCKQQHFPVWEDKGWPNFPQCHNSPCMQPRRCTSPVTWYSLLSFNSFCLHNS